MNAPVKLSQSNNQEPSASNQYKKQSFADVSYEEMIERAKELIPFLSSEAAATEKQTHLTDAVVNKLHESGLFRYQQPKMWGGMEVDFRAFMEVPYLLGLGCPSTGWVFANVAAHSRQLAQWSMQAQEDIWGDDPNALIASGVAYVQGKGELVQGGLILSGYWGFSSGVDICEWNMLSCVVKENDRVVDWCVCLLPRDDYEIIDDWQTMGMKGTGSRSVKCENVFVPAHRVISMNFANPNHEFPGFKIHQNSMFRIPTSSVGGNGIAGAMIANARMMLAETIDWIKSKNTSYTGAKMADIPTLQMKIAIADGKIDAAYQWLTANTIEAELAYKNNEVFDMATKLKYKRNTAMAMKMANEAVDLLHELLGANGIFEKHPFERRFRDAHASAGHMVFNLDAQYIPMGLVSLGGEFKNPTL